MAKRRSKKDKQRSQIKREQQQTHFKSNFAPSVKTKFQSLGANQQIVNQQIANQQTVAAQVQDLFAYPVQLIYQDLVKTCLVAAIVFALLAALAIYL